MSHLYKKMPYAERANRRERMKAAFQTSQVGIGSILDRAFGVGPILALLAVATVAMTFAAIG